MKVTSYLKKIEEYGFKAYVVGGFVRDYLLGIESNDVDIATSATPKDLSSIFPNSKNTSFGCTNIKDGDLNIDITTYRRESNYKNRRPQDVEYIDDILEDLKRRDFTINAICMESDETIFDPLNGQVDLDNKLLRVIGDVESKFKDDPLRMLRALRFSIIYDFKLESRALNFIRANLNLFDEISLFRRKEELSKILISSRSKEGLSYLKELGVLKIFKIDYNEKYNNTSDLVGSWAVIEGCEDYPFTKVERERLTNIRTIISSNKIDNMTLFTYGLYESIISGELLGIKRSEIEYLWNSMPIHHKEELSISGDQIKDILGISSSPKIKEIKKDLINKILSGNLTNNEGCLSSYIIENWK